MLDSLGSLVVGVVIGVVGSVLAWIATIRGTRPKINIGSNISRISPPVGDADRKYLYRAKLQNARRRKAIDVTISCRLSVVGLFEDRPKTRNNYDVPVGTSDLVELRGHKNRAVWLHLHQAEKLRHRLKNAAPALASK